MAYDPQARKQSNSALIFGLIALLVVGGAALAYFATRQPATPETGAVIVNHEKETIVASTPAPQTNTTIVVAPTAAPAAPNTVIVTPPVGNTTTETKTTTRNTDPSPRAPVASPPVDRTQSKTTVNNTIINPPAPSANASKAKPIAPDSTNADNAATPDVATNAATADSNSVEGY